MFRFTIRDVLWLTVVVACLVAWWIDRAGLSSANNALKNEQAELRMAALRAKELQGQIILPMSPNLPLRTLEQRGFELPRAEDKP